MVSLFFLKLRILNTSMRTTTTRLMNVLLWNDPAVYFQWLLEGEPVLLQKDKVGVLLQTLQV